MIKEYLDQIEIMSNCIDISKIRQVISAIYDAGKLGNTIYVMGNGGSASTASHFVCDLKKATNNKLRIVALTDNISIITACANDYNYESIFVNQLKDSLREGDIVIAFSGSGMSKNIIKAIEYTNENHAITIGITGYDGGILKKISKLGINIPINDMQISEDFHLIITHIIMKKMQNIIW